VPGIEIPQFTPESNNSIATASLHLSILAVSSGKAPLEIKTIQVETIDGTRSDYYPVLTESKTETRDTGEIDEDGNQITEEVETNLFFNATLA